MLERLKLLCFGTHSHSFFFDTGTFTASFAEEVQLGAPNTTHFVQLDAFNIWRKYGEQTLNTYTIADFSYGESGCRTGTLAFDHVSFETLDTLFVALYNFIVNRNIIARFESW
jgi:hypothetical protein